MSAHPLNKVIELWRAGKLTEEQAIGQMLLLLQGLQKRLDELERRESEKRRAGESQRDSAS
jgi:hypothetical protein